MVMEYFFKIRNFLPLIPLPAVNIGIIICIIYLERSLRECPYQRVILLLLNLLVVIGNLSVYYAFHRYKRSQKEIKLQKDVINVQEVQLNHFQRAESVNRKNAEFHHDMCHYLKAIGNLAEEDESEQIITLLNELETEFSQIQKVEFCANPIINTVLNEGLEEAKKMQVDCRIYVEPGFTPGSIKEIDMISILGNLYNNALEAAGKCQNGFIDIKMFMQNGGNFMVIKMKNSYVGTILKSGEHFRTIKKDKENHGIGMEKIKEVVKKYCGSFFADYKDGIFDAVLVMPI